MAKGQAAPGTATPQFAGQWDGQCSYPLQRVEPDTEGAAQGPGPFAAHPKPRHQPGVGFLFNLAAKSFSAPV